MNSSTRVVHKGWYRSAEYTPMYTFVKVAKSELCVGSIIRDVGLVYNRAYDPTWVERHRHTFIKLPELIQHCGGQIVGRVCLPPRRRLDTYLTQRELSDLDRTTYPHKGKLFEITKLFTTSSLPYGNDAPTIYQAVMGQEVEAVSLRRILGGVTHEWHEMWWYEVTAEGALSLRWGFPPFDLLQKRSVAPSLRVWPRFTDSKAAPASGVSRAEANTRAEEQMFLLT